MWGPRVADIQPAQRLAEAAGSVGAAVVGHDALDLDALAAEPAQGAQKEGRRGGLALIGEDLDIGHSGCIIDRHMHEVPACAPVTAARARAGDAVAGPVEPSELLDVEMDQLSGPVALIPARRSRWIKLCQPAQAYAHEPSRDSRTRQAELAGDLRPGQP